LANYVKKYLINYLNSLGDYNLCLFFQGHNFLTTVAKGPIKNSQYADFSLVSLKKINPRGWSPGLGHLGQTSLNLYFHLICHSPNNFQIFFIRRY